MKKQRAKKIVYLLLVLIALFATLRWFLPAISSEQFKTAIESAGPLGPLILIGLIILGHVFAPITGAPFALISFVVFGIVQTTIYIYIGSILSAAICFYISRRWGRDLVKKFVGEKTMGKVDQFSEKSGIKALIVARLIGFSLFEIVSYAAGLTIISFRDYMIVTLFVPLVPTTIFLIIFSQSDFSDPKAIIIWLVTIVIVGIVFTGVLYKIYTGNKRNNPTDSIN